MTDHFVIRVRSRVRCRCGAAEDMDCETGGIRDAHQYRCPSCGLLASVKVESKVTVIVLPREGNNAHVEVHHG